MSLQKALELLSNGNVLVMQSIGRNRVFYNKECDPDKNTFCFINCTKWPGLLDVGEWDWYIFRKGYKEQLDPYMLKVFESEVKNKTYYELSM